MKLVVALILALAAPAHAARATATVLPADAWVINDPSHAITTSVSTVQQGPYLVVTVNYN